MSYLMKLVLMVGAVVCALTPARAQMPFYTDDPEVTARGTLHFEFFNEFDALQSSEFPNLRQNTANFKVNYGLPHNLELDLDGPYLSIYRATGTQSAGGMGDTNLGLKWKIRSASPGSHAPALATSLYIEFPTGDERQQLGSGLTDYWLNFIAQEPFTDKTRLNMNLGFLFAGNTSTGVVGVQNTRGHVYTGGASLLHDFSPRLTLGGEFFGAIADTAGLARTQLQFLGGGQFAIREGFSLTFGLIGGKYTASPSIGGQFGFAWDIARFGAARKHNPSDHNPSDVKSASFTSAFSERRWQ
jgi:hypothetical protein